VVLLLAAFCTSFFRDFDRATPLDDALIYSPADGLVVDVSTVTDGPQASWKIIRIFLSVFDGHVQRSPVTGQVQAVIYTKGKFLDARHISAHLENEQNNVIITSKKGTVHVKQIAGLIARRIVCWVKPQDVLKQGERFGLIRFGSQVDLLMPASVDVVATVGQRVLGGLTVVAEWKT
jgi:phosphatidylserine decarboxylase